MRRLQTDPIRAATSAILATAWYAAGPERAFAAAPLNFLESFGTKADSILSLTWGLLAISIIVVILMTGLVVWAILRSRPPGETGNDIRPEGRPVDSFKVFGFGLGITTLVLVACVVWTMVTLADVGQPPQKPELTIAITGHQWWWGIRYLSNEPAQVFQTANEFHIPTGVPVKVTLRSDDVIHSFWVPSLTGKTDLIPGQVNTTWIQAKKPGTYLGQCAEYCGAQHAHMAIRVVAEPADKFDAWRNDQLKSAAPPASDNGKAGLAVFERRCAGCHTVRGTNAGGIYGPDLSHLMTRATLADGTILNAGGYLAGWIADPQHIKPGSRMPRVALSGDELQAVTSYLRTLR
ncbi:MAG TPA: cytochrome c oxidase subunit II [Hyphomicrobium sp.]|nr:cytochrome c oxidase subunit II [Hyphomicrobium sp.]